MKTLIIYYSLTNNTKHIAQKLAQTLNADTLELKPEKEISKSLMRFIWGGRQVYMKTKPKLQEYQIDPNNYDTIIIGTPVWAWTYPPPLRTFFSQTKLENKKIALFCCHDGGPKKTIEDMKKMLPNNQFLPCKEFKSVTANKEKIDEEIKQWVRTFDQ